MALMEVSAFLDDPTVQAEVARLVTERSERETRGERLSDIVDSAGHQYVDFVCEGGGVLGIALVGYTYGLEQAGVRFLGIGGASAGAINAMLLAAAGAADAAKSELVLGHLAKLDMSRFVDGGADARALLKAFGKPGRGFLGKAVAIARNIGDLRRDWGLNPGDAFHAWMSEVLATFGIRSKEDLDLSLGALPIGIRDARVAGAPQGTLERHLCLVTAEVQTQSKVIFPKMAELFYREPKQAPPADFVRASMSIPLFFSPLRKDDLPTGREAKAAWKAHTGYQGAPPSPAIFIDGGIVSNFPISLFHVDGVPRYPTFGAKLGTDRKESQGIDSLPGLLMGTFNAARHTSDYDFLFQNKDYREVIGIIETGDHHWLNFSMEAAEKIELFRLGLQAAGAFLRRFDWERYREIRRQ